MVFGLGLLGFGRDFQLVLGCLCLLSGYPKLANHSDVYRCDLKLQLGKLEMAQM